MAVVSSSGPWTLSNGRVLIILSLGLIWWFSQTMPVYQDELKSRIQEARLRIPSIKVDWSPTDDPRARYDSSKVAMLIEPRPLPHLVPHILHMTSVVPPDWRLVFIGSKKSVISVSASYAVKHQQVTGKLDLMVLPEPWGIDSKENVNRLLTDMRFYDEFLPGVEWLFKSIGEHVPSNGGLSMRRVSAVRRVLRIQERYNDTDPEDWWFSKRLWLLPGDKAPTTADGVLAADDVFMEKPMGYHVKDGGQGISDDVWGNPEQRKKIFDYCPEISLIMDMKLESERCPDDNHEGNIVSPFVAGPELPEGQEVGQEGQEGQGGQDGQEGQEAQEVQPVIEENPEPPPPMIGDPLPLGY